MALLREAIEAAPHVWEFHVDLAKELLRQPGTPQQRRRVSALFSAGARLQPHSCEAALRAAEFHISADSEESRSQRLAEAYARAACVNCAGGKEAVNACVLHANALAWAGDWAGAKTALETGLSFADKTDQSTKKYLLDHIRAVEKNI